MPKYESGSLRNGYICYYVDSIIFLNESTKYGIFSLSLKNLTKWSAFNANAILPVINVILCLDCN